MTYWRAWALSQSTAGGVNEWKADFAEKLRGRHVVILPDCDAPGRDLAQRVARSLRGVAASAKIIELPALPEKGDVSDYAEERRTAGKSDDDIRAELRALIDATDPEPAEIPDDGQAEDRTLWMPIPEGWRYQIGKAGELYKVIQKERKKGEESTTETVYIPIAGFDAAILEELTVDDGA